MTDCNHESQFIDGHWRCLRCGEHAADCPCHATCRPNRCPICGFPFDLQIIYSTKRCSDQRHRYSTALTPEENPG